MFNASTFRILLAVIKSVGWEINAARRLFNSFYIVFLEFAFRGSDAADF